MPCIVTLPPGKSCGVKASRSRVRLRVKTQQTKKKKNVISAQRVDVSAVPSAPISIPTGNWSKIGRGVTAPEGFRAAGLAAGLRSTGTNPDLSLVYCDRPAVAAGVFTQNVLCAAPVTYDKKMLETQSHFRAVLINAGQANAATGDEGYADTVKSAAATAERLSIAPNEVLIMSTGMIGQRVKMDRVLAYIPSLTYSLNSGPETDVDIAVAMTTTDLVYKMAALETEISGKVVKLGGVCKGSGMIHPNMATLLGVMTCDAPVEPSVWRDMLRQAVDSSFNRITVDGDTSTNDTILALSSGVTNIPTISDRDSKAAVQLQEALTALCKGLAKSVAWDGEGATCLIEASVIGAASDGEAGKVAKSIVGSNLVKAAVYGHDPNWGRIAAAAGYAGVTFDPKNLDISLENIPLMRNGTPQSFDRSQASNYLKEQCSHRGTVKMEIKIGDGQGEGVAWGCDLSHDYVRINAEYTT